MSSFSPFSREELLPQEEKLEIKKSKGRLFIGLPKETHYEEKRVCLTPDAVAALTANGHSIVIETLHVILQFHTLPRIAKYTHKNARSTLSHYIRSCNQYFYVRY